MKPRINPIATGLAIAGTCIDPDQFACADVFKSNNTSIGFGGNN